MQDWKLNKLDVKPERLELGVAGTEGVGVEWGDSGDAEEVARGLGGEGGPAIEGQTRVAYKEEFCMVLYYLFIVLLH